MAGDEGITELLRRADAGDRSANERIFRTLAGDLQRQARRYMRGQPRNHTLEADGLVHEAYIKVHEGKRGGYRNRGHFLAVMSIAMRQTLIDHANRKHRQRRGGGRSREPLTGCVVPFEDRVAELVELHELLGLLREENDAAARVVELRYFMGLSIAEAAELLERSPKTVERLWDFARTWLRMRLAG
jgi:RNA polymerase sigma factor (TIGR02999 family)